MEALDLEYNLNEDVEGTSAGYSTGTVEELAAGPPKGLSGKACKNGLLWRESSKQNMVISGSEDFDYPSSNEAEANSSDCGLDLDMSDLPGSSIV